MKCATGKIHLAEIRDAQNEAYRVQDVRLPATVKSGDRVEFLIETVYLDPFAVGFESLQHHRFDVHVKKAAKLSRCGKSVSTSTRCQRRRTKQLPRIQNSSN